MGINLDSTADVYGFNPRFFSGRAKSILARIDPEGFEFVECDTFDRSGTRIESYWMANAVRVVPEFDEVRSSFKRFAEENPESGDPSNPNIVTLNDIYMPPGFPRSYHVFYLARYPAHFIVDGAIADAWTREELTGARLTPLQPPTDEELGADQEQPSYLSFLNHPYWAR